MDNNKIKCSYSVHAVIFGADESLLKIQLKDGFGFERLSINPMYNHLDEIFDTSDIGLRRDYESARLDQTSVDVVCVVKENAYVQDRLFLNEQFRNDADQDLVSLDNQIRIIRLLKEGPVRFKKIAFHQKVKYNVDGISYSSGHNAIVPIGEAMTTKPISVFHCDDGEVASINKELSRLTLPLSDSLSNSCHKYYDLSYHTEPCISITLLTTALEVLFLERDAKSKRKTLAKRCAAFLYENDAQRLQQSYNDVITLYDKRSDFVHEGTASNITNADIISLRAVVRDALLKSIYLSENKDQRIARLKQVVTNNSWLSGK